LSISAKGDWRNRLRAWFPDREFFMRSEGQVRFIKISSRLQVIAVAIVVTMLAGWIATMAGAAYNQFASNKDRLDLINREASVATAENRVSEYREDIDAVASDLEKRQDILEQLGDAYFGDLPVPPASATPAGQQAQSGNTSEAARAVSTAVPEASGLGRIATRQLAFVERLTFHADRRAARAAQAIRKLGLNPGTMVAATNKRDAQGGPLISLTTSATGSLDPRFRRLGASLARMEALERGLAGIPQVEPADMDFISSGFGFRADPFTGGGAFHAGLDFRGPIGAPIYAAAKGRVSFAGVRQGYGKCVEIDHGNGLVTRYAHMSAFRTRVGQKVNAGAIIGAIGNTGRSTGPHLHFEVRIHDRPVNPRPFLEAAPHVLEEARAHGAAGGK